MYIMHIITTCIVKFEVKQSYLLNWRFMKIQLQFLSQKIKVFSAKTHHIFAISVGRRTRTQENKLLSKFLDVLYI